MNPAVVQLLTNPEGELPPLDGVVAPPDDVLVALVDVLLEVVVLVAAIIDVSTRATVLSAQVYVVARLAHYAIYTAGIPVIRTLAFLAGAIATVVIAAVLLFSAG